jgi:tetratricopeptide (TPR) repeat protein
MEDGTPPTERVSIERVCNGRARREAYTDSKGYFTFTIDNRQPQTVMQDASVGADSLDPTMRPSGLTMGSNSMVTSDPSGTNGLYGCELRAFLAGATSETVQLTGRRPFDDPNVGTIVLRRMGKVGGATVSLTSLQAPGKAKKAFEQGKKSLEKGKDEEAKADFSKAVEIFPNYAEAWVELSDLDMKVKDLNGARDACEHAVAADPRYVQPYFTLIVLAAGKEDWKRTVEMSDKLLALDSHTYAAAHYYNALGNYKLGNLDKADRAIHTARKLDPNNKLPKIGLLMAAIMMDRNDFAGAAQEYRTFLDNAPANSADVEYARNSLAMAQQKLAAANPPK